MFWRFGGYANVSSIDTILDKPDVTLEELLDDGDLLQELKQHNTKLIEYLREENVLRRLLEYVIEPKIHISGRDNTVEGPPSGRTYWTSSFAESSSSSSVGTEAQSMSVEEYERREKARMKYANVACEILSSETWSILEALMENQQHLRQFWTFLKREPPLDPIEAGYFTKVNETLLDKKTEDMLVFLKTLDGVVNDILQHIDCPVVMDLLLKIISLDKAEGGQGIVEWLHSQDLIPSLLSYLSPEHSSATQTSAGDFLKAIITISANASQNEQSCIGPNELTRQLVSEVCIEKLISHMLRGGSALTVGVGIIIEVIRKNNSDYDPEVGTGLHTLPSSRDPIYLGTLLRMFAQSIPKFMSLILNPDHRATKGAAGSAIKTRELKVASGNVIEPLGFDRFKTCELMAELLHCSNMALLNEPGSEVYIRQRDLERERLKAEGVLPREKLLRQEADFAEISMSSDQDGLPSAHNSEALEEIRRLEVANAGEEDGFEDVAISADLIDERKVNPEVTKQRKHHSRSWDDNSFDHSPGREGDPDTSKGHQPESSRPDINSEDDRMEIEQAQDAPPAEPTKSPTSQIRGGVTSKVSSIHLEQDTHNSKPPSPSAAETSSSEEKRLEEEQSAVVRSSHPPSNEQRSTPQPERRGSFGPPSPTGNMTPTSPDALSPHAEDHPAPLFFGRVEQNPASKQMQNETAEKHDAGINSVTESVDTTLGEEGDSIRSVLISGNDIGIEPQIETDADGSPVVGDYLKMIFVEHHIVPTILNFFFRFPWNNFLHNVVYDVVQQVFNGPMDRGFNRTLAVDLFDSGRITEQIVNGQRKSDESQARSNMRLGYMGHLTLIAEEVVKFSERHPPEFLSKSVLDMVLAPEWVEYVGHTLAETRERDNAILGGVRPDMAGGPRQAVMNSLNAAPSLGNGASAALANAGLTGGSAGLDSMDLINSSGGSGVGFGFNNHNLLSGFGSSSDEEDEMMEEENDRDDVRRSGTDSTDQASQSSSAQLSGSTEVSSSNNAPSEIPKIPPPPPPLNIPPSRARRQLAARLALKFKAKQQEGQMEENEESEGGETSARDDMEFGSFAESEPLGAANAGITEPEEWTLRQADEDQSNTSSLSSTSSSSEDDDDSDLSLPPHPSPQGLARPIPTGPRTRSLLEADDDDEGEVVDFGREEPEALSDDEDSGDLVEIKRPISHGLEEREAT